MSRANITRHVFPSIAATLGGAEFLDLSPRKARVKLPGRAELVTVPRSKVPKYFTAFNLADLAQNYAK